MKAQREQSPKARDAQRISIGMTIVALLGAGGVIYSAATNPIPDFTPWVAYFAPALVLPTLIGALIGVWYSYQNQPERAAQFIIGGLLLTTLLVPTIAARRAAYLAILTVAVSISIATMTMSDRRATRTIVFVVASGIVVVLSDLIYPFPRLTGGNLTPIGLIILCTAAAVFIVLAAVRFNTFQLRSKLLILFALIPGLIIGIIGVYLITNINNQTLQQTKSAIMGDLEAKRLSITTLLTNAAVDARFLSQSTVIADYLRLQETSSDPDALAAARDNISAEFLALAQAKGAYHQVRFFDNHGQEIAHIYMTPSGIATAVPAQSLQTSGIPGYVAPALGRGPAEIYISALVYDESSGVTAVHYGAPVIVNGKKAGVVILSVSAEQLFAPLENARYQSWLVDREGHYLYHPDPAKRWGHETETANTIWQDAPALSEQVFNSDGQTREVDQELDYYTYTSVSLAGEASSRWVLINHLPTETLWAPINRTMAPMQAVLAIILLLTPLMALYISQSIGAPITQITEAAQQVASENLNVKLQIQRQDELGALADAFSMMTQRLSSFVNLLEARVSERTRDLVLAAEVGSRLAQVREMDVLLAEAVEIIRSRFDLYYAQIYLVEGVDLVLHAGTGAVGSNLLARRFRLPVGPGSINGTAAAEKRPVIVADTAGSPLFLPNPLLPDTRSEMSVPLMIGERIVGVLNMQSTQPNALTADNLPAFETLASQLAIAIENARLFAEIQQARAEVEAQTRFLTHEGWEEYLSGIQRREFVGYRYAEAQLEPLAPDDSDAAASHNMPITVAGEIIGHVRVSAGEQALPTADQKILETIAQQVGQRLENLRLLAEAEQYRLEAEQAAQRVLKKEWEAYQQEASLSGFVYDRFQVTAVTDTNGDAAPQTALTQPLTLRGQPIGYLAVNGPTSAEAPQAMITAVADQLAQHIENLRLSSLTAQRAAQLAIINQIAQDISRQVATQDIIETVYQQLQAVFTADGFHLGLYDEASGKMDYPLLYEDGRRTQQMGMPLSPHSNAYRVIHSGEPLLRNLTPAEIEEIRRAQPEVIIGNNDSRITHSLIFVPLRAGQRIFGVLSVQSYRPNAYNQSDLDLLNGIASYVAVGLENARLFEQRERALAQLQNRSAELALINRIMADVSGALDLRESMQIITDRLAEAVSAEQIGVALLNEDATHLTIVAEKYDPHKSSSAVGITIPVKGNPSTERVLATRQTVVVKDAQHNPLTAPIHKELEQRGVQTLIIIPMTAGSEIMGTVGIDILDPAVDVSPEQVRLAETIVLQAATAAQKARLFEQTQAALSETATLYQASTALNEAASYTDILQALQRHTVLGAKAQHVAIDYFNHPWTQSQQPDYFDVLSYLSQLETGLQQTRYYLADFPEIADILTPNAPTLIENIAATDKLSEQAKALYLRAFRSQATVFVPLTVGGQWLGFINALFAKPTTLTEPQLRRLMAIGNQAAIAVQGIRLLESANTRAKREEMLRAIAAKVRSSADVDVVMRTAVREIGQALGRQTFVDLGHQPNGKPGRTQEEA